MTAEAVEDALAPALSALGLSSFGWFQLAAADFPAAGAPEGIRAGDHGLLVGNRAVAAEHLMWRVFRQSPEYGDGDPDPLDRWTARVIEPIAAEMGAVALYPFAKPVWPFQRWAIRATGMRPSPLGILIHPEYGLWQAFRAVLVCRRAVRLPPAPPPIHPCDSCLEKPCLSACPVAAFSATGFNSTACRAHLRAGDPPDCRRLGCRARAACPVGTPYTAAQLHFHMAAFER